MTFLIFSAKIWPKIKKAHALLDFSKSSDEKQISKLERPNVTSVFYIIIVSCGDHHTYIMF